ncbi:unnamed protein product, partial [marine sediment metagenome]
MYKPEDIELPSSFQDIKNLYNHQYLGKHLKNPPFKKAFIRESTEEEVRKLTALTYAAISYVDSSIGEILASLEKQGYSENTMVIFTSDHGDLMGDHGLLFKGPCPFNGVLNIPLIWKVPGLTKPSVSNALVSTIDLPKTILNLLNIKERHHPPGMQGYDISILLDDPNKKIRDCVLIENDEEVIEEIQKHVSYAKEHYSTILFSAEDATRSDLDYLIKANLTAIESGATRINVPDTVGTISPKAYGYMINNVYKAIPKGIRIAVH